MVNFPHWEETVSRFNKHPIAAIALEVFLLLLSATLFGGGMYRFVYKPYSNKLIELQKRLKLSGGEFTPPSKPKAGQCPICGGEETEITALIKFTRLNWMISPFMALPILIFGFRMPKDYEECKDCSCQFVNCHSCEMSIDWLEAWPKPFKYYRGLFCPHCSEKIPCLQNWLAWILVLPIKPFLLLFPQKSSTTTSH